MRAFVAAYPSTEAIEHLDAFLDARREAASFRWSHPEHFHLTLAFYGDVPDRSFDALTDGLRSAAAKRTSTMAAIAGGGAFPSVDRAKVLWAGVDLKEQEQVRKLASACRTAGATAGASPSGERFRPHLTVARIGRPVEASKWVRLLDSYRGPSWSIDEIVLVESHLGEGARRRPRHELIDRFALS